MAYSVNKVWMKIYCHFYFRGITLKILYLLRRQKSYNAYKHQKKTLEALLYLTTEHSTPKASLFVKYTSSGLDDSLDNLIISKKTRTAFLMSNCHSTCSHLRGMNKLIGNKWANYKCWYVTVHPGSLLKISQPPAQRPLQVLPSPSSRKMYHDKKRWNSWHTIQQGAEKITNYATIFGWKMCQLYGKQTGLWGQTSTVDKIDKNAFWLYRTTVRVRTHFQGKSSRALQGPSRTLHVLGNFKGIYNNNNNNNNNNNAEFI